MAEPKILLRCVDDDNRPNDIPLSKWVVFDQIYTVKRFVNSNINGLFVELEELDINGCGAYGGFAVGRFIQV